MVLPLLALGGIGAAVAGTGLGGLLFGSKKDCSTLAAQRCSKGGIGEIWKGEEVDWNCYNRVYSDCVKEREGTVAKLTEKQKNTIMFGAIGLIGLGLIGKYGLTK